MAKKARACTLESKEGFQGIGTENEKSLHSALKKWYARPGDELEAKVDGYIIDILREGELIEIQTGNFSAIAKKLKKLLSKHSVRLVYPVPKEKWITRITDTGKFISRRKSPKKGGPLQVFTELIRIPAILTDENLIIEVILTKEEEVWCEDGRGSWRRKGVSLKDRRLLEVVGRIELKTKEEFLSFFPEGLEEPFTNKSLSFKMGEPVRLVRKVTYCLKKSGFIREVGKNGNELFFAVVREDKD